jgi:hypothetical protein
MSAAVDAKTSSLSRAEEAVRSGRQQLQRLELRLEQLRSQKAQVQVNKVGLGGRAQDRSCWGWWLAAAQAQHSAAAAVAAAAVAAPLPACSTNDPPPHTRPLQEMAALLKSKQEETEGTLRARQAEAASTSLASQLEDERRALQELAASAQQLRQERDRAAAASDSSTRLQWVDALAGWLAVPRAGTDTCFPPPACCLGCLLHYPSAPPPLALLILVLRS